MEPCPDFKGIETAYLAGMAQPSLLEPCPDFKGIETCRLSLPLGYVRLEPCPDFKGIETVCVLDVAKMSHVGTMP